MKVLVADTIHEKGIEILRSEGFEVDVEEVSPRELLERIGEYDALIVRSRTKVTAEVIERGVNLKVIGRAGVGVDNIDVKSATERGIKVVNAPVASTNSVAELTIGHMIAMMRWIPEATQSMKSGKWEKKRFMGRELQGKVLGLVGSGRIGTEVAKRAQAFGMRTIAYDPYLPKEIAERNNIQLLDSLEELLKESDVISVHAALTEETYHMLDYEKLKLMKKGSYIVNCARGGIVDEDALYRLLKEGHLAGAALDVYEREPPGKSPLFELPNISLTPHIGASTKEAQRRAAEIIAEEVVRALKGEEPRFWVNRGG
ncbi:MAG TPA: phosphoglycerate dehydrogenase [Euryarchaeota archaeon]|nr:phosphoglycerate dehydrogenase [Euryarchaeota archaeon]